MAEKSMGRTYGTSDIWLAAFLKAKNVKLTGTEREGRRCIFLFEDRPDREQLLLEYSNNTFINTYRHSLDDLKSLVYNY